MHLPKHGRNSFSPFPLSSRSIVHCVPLGGSHFLTSFLKWLSSYGQPHQLHASWQFLKGKRHSLALLTYGCNRYTAFIGLSAHDLQFLLRIEPILIQTRRPACVIPYVVESRRRFLLRHWNRRARRLMFPQRSEE